MIYLLKLDFVNNRRIPLEDGFWARQMRPWVDLLRMPFLQLSSEDVSNLGFVPNAPTSTCLEPARRAWRRGVVKMAVLDKSRLPF